MKQRGTEHGAWSVVVPVVISNIGISRNITILIFILILIITIMTIVIPWEETGLQRGEGTRLKTRMEVEGLGQAVPRVNKKCFCVNTLHAYDNVGLHPPMKDVFLLKRLLWNCGYETYCSEEGVGPRVHVLRWILSPHWLTLSMTLSNSLPFEAQFLHLQIRVLD